MFILCDNIIIDVPDNLSVMLEIEFPTHKKDDQVALINFEVNDVVNKVSNKIDDNVDDYVFVLDDNKVHVMLAPNKKDEFVREDVNDNEVINDYFADRIFTVKKFS